MSQKYTIIGNGPKACVRMARVVDDEVGNFGHTPQARVGFPLFPRRKCSNVPTRSCALLLKLTQNRSRLNTSLAVSTV